MIEALVFARIKTLAGGRVFPGVAPPDTPPPYMTYTRVSGTRGWTLAGPNGLVKASIQINAWAVTPRQAAEILEAAFGLLSQKGGGFSCVGADDVPSYDDQISTKLHGAAMEFHLIR